MAVDKIIEKLVARRWLFGNVAARSLFALQMSGFAVLYLEPTDSARLFQLLLFQVTVSVVMTGSGYVRGAAAQQRGEIKGALAGVVGLSVIGVVVLVLVEVLLGGRLRQYVPYDSEFTWIIMLVGAGCNAIVTTMQGILAAARHDKAAFMPGVVASICGAVLALVWHTSVQSLIAAWSIYQIISMILILLLVIRLMKHEIGKERTIAPRQVMKEISSACQIGIFAAASMLAVYAFRDKWRVEANPHIVEMVFFALRFSDLFFQFVFYAFALGQRGRFSDWARSNGTRLGSALALALIIFVVAGVLLASNQLHPLLVVLMLIVLHVGTDSARFFSSWACIDALRELTPLRYLLVTVTPYIFGAGVVWLLFKFSHAAALYVFLFTAAVLQSVFIVFAKDAHVAANAR